MKVRAPAGGRSGREVEFECEPGDIEWRPEVGGYRVGEFIYPSKAWQRDNVGPELPRTDTASQDAAD